MGLGEGQGDYQSKKEKTEKKKKMKIGAKGEGSSYLRGGLQPLRVRPAPEAKPNYVGPMEKKTGEEETAKPQKREAPGEKAIEKPSVTEILSEVKQEGELRSRTTLGRGIDFSNGNTLGIA